MTLEISLVIFFIPLGSNVSVIPDQIILFSFMEKTSVKKIRKVNPCKAFT
ncbi:hypothetical protein SAMN05660845_1005 [Flavobacterium swingsii]|uniref:Uncharacterized protein n=1 Tax=Flavobacterium swingsii TaxID=498292 RepID=A0A1I0WW57_9FLAO|nr:hypothetical protein SAMN05660845_1005 [Flavobacterium swingsii]